MKKISDAKDIKKVIHELEIHKIELKIQNEELRKSQIEIQKSHQKYIDLYDSAPVGYFTVDQTGKIAEANLTVAAMLSVERGFLIDKLFYQFIVKEDYDILYLYLKKVFKSKKCQRCELTLKGNSDTALYAQLDSTYINDSTGNHSCRITITDITDRKQVEVALLRENDRKYNSLIEVIPDIVFKIDNNGYFIYINRAIRVLEYQPEELIGKHFSAIINQSTFKSISRAIVLPKYAGKKIGDEKAPKLFDERRCGKRMTRNLEVRLLPKYKKTVNNDEMEFKYFPFSFCEITATGDYGIGENRNNGRKLLGTLGIIKDATEKKQLQAETIRKGQLALIGELAACIAHEINSPLNIITICAELLRNRFNKGEEDYNTVNNIITESARIIEVIKSILSFTRERKKEDTGYFDIYEVLNDMLTLVMAQTKRERIRIILIFPPDLPKILVHPQLIQQAFLNIINNARDALNEKYPDVHDDKIIKISWEKVIMDNLPYLKITFHDKGLGIPADQIDQVMKPFFTTKRIGQGTGLGLSICNQIISNHYGKIEIDSVEHEYTKIIISLPITEECH